MDDASNSMNIILGSTSPRRKSILSGIFTSFRIIPPDVDETQQPSERPLDFARRISEEKSRTILTNGAIIDYPALVITSDTIVTIDGLIIGKPSDYSDAVNILSSLNGRTHRVITALTLLYMRDGADISIPSTGFETTDVTFKKLDPDGIRLYLDSIEYHDKAGSYAFQENGSMIIEQYSGSVTNIIGFPLRLFFSMAAELGLIGALFNLENVT